MDSSLSRPGGLYAFYWCQIFALDYTVVKTKNWLVRMEASLLMQCIITEKRSCGCQLLSFSSLPLNHSRRVVVSYNQKYVHEVLVNYLFKLAQEKVWLGELTIPQ